MNFIILLSILVRNRHSHWPLGLRRGTAEIVGSNPARIPGEWMFVVFCCQVEVSATS